MKFTLCGNDWHIETISNSEMNMLCDSDKKNTFVHGLTMYSTLTIYLNEDAPDKKKTLIHELTHCFMYEYGHNQHEKVFNNEDVCEISSCCHDIIHKIIEEYFKEKKNGRKVTENN